MTNNNKISTLTDFVGDHIASNFSVRPDTLDSMAAKVRLAVVELQKENLFPETTIEFVSLDMKEEFRDSLGEVIYHYYDLPKDFRMLFNNGPALDIDGHNMFKYVDYGRFIVNMSRYHGTGGRWFTVRNFNGEFGKRNILIITPFPEDQSRVSITYYSNGVDMPIEQVDEQYYMPVINHVLHQMGLIDQQPYRADVIKTKRNHQDPAGQGSHHQSFARLKSTFFGNHRGRR